MGVVAFKHEVRTLEKQLNEERNLIREFRKKDRQLTENGSMQEKQNADLQVEILELRRSVSKMEEVKNVFRCARGLIADCVPFGLPGAESVERTETFS
eukprot:756673-Hanusia_phi.AAC.1